MERKDYKFEGSLYEFLGIVQWSLTVRQAHKDGREDGFDIATNPKKNLEAAEEYGITTENLIKELVRLGREAEDSVEYNLYKMEELRKYSFDKTFLERLKDNEVTIDDIDDYVEYWHSSKNPSKSLREYLGLTSLEYDRWAKEGNDIFLELIS